MTFRRIRYLVIVGALLACGESATAPPTPPPAPPPQPPPPPPPPPGPPNPRVFAGDTINGVVFESGRITYSFAAAGAEYALFFEASSGGGTILVRDSVSNVQVAQVSDLAGGPGLETQVTNNFSGPGIFLLEMIGGMPDTTRFRFYIYTVNRAPESRSARFAIGDTVSGESIDQIPDVDDFLLAGHVGQYLAGWVEPLGPRTTSSLLSMVIVDPPLSNQLGFTSGVIGQSPRQLFRVGPLPNDRDFRFTVPGSNPPGTGRYTGPYRFHAYEIDPAPEGGDAALPFNMVVAGTIEVAGDIDAFTFPADSGQEFNAFLQSAAARPITALIVGPTQGLLQSPTSAPADTGMFVHGSGRFRTVKDSTFGISVYGQPYEDATGSYRLYLYRINRAPETVAAVVPIGDTISGEAIDLPGDIDVFTISGSAGQQVNLFVQTESASFEGLLFSLHDPAGHRMYSTSVRGPGTSLFEQGTGRFTLPTTGSYQLQFEGATGPYRFFVYPVNPQPETHAATISFRDSIENESIDVPGDVDEFAFSVSDSSNATLFLEAGGITYGAEVSIVRAGTGERIPLGYYSSFTIGPGSYVLRVESSPYPGAGAGSYRLWLYPWSTTVESTSETVAIGDTIDSEQLDPPGDVDIFYFNGIKGQHVNFAFQGTSASSNGGYSALLYHPTNLMGWVSTPTSSPSLDSRQTTRLDLPVTGQYKIRIQGGNARVEHGPYRFALTLVDTLPEHVGTAVVPGDSVTDELTDTPGDWDQFDLTGTPGEDLGLIFQSSGSGGAYPWIVATDPATRDTLEGTVGQFVRLAGPFPVPASGHVRVEVFERPTRFYECYDATCGGVYRFTGSYGFRVVRINRAPENVSATYTVGDTVRAEAIDTADVDEFYATAAPGTPLNAFLRVTATPIPSGSGLTLEIINRATGDTLIGRGLQITGQAELYHVGTFTVPSNGQFLIRIRGSGFWGEDMTTAPYEFVVK